MNVVKSQFDRKVTLVSDLQFENEYAMIVGVLFNEVPIKPISKSSMPEWSN